MLVKPFEREAYWIDQEINDRGVKIDVPFVEAAIEIANAQTGKLIERARHLTGLTNPRSLTQLRKWLTEEMDEDSVPETLDKKAVSALLKTTDDEVISDVLQIRQQLGKSSVSKYQAMLRSVGADGRVRGLFQYYGASRTGRFASKIVQLQNLPQNKLGDLDLARRIVRRGDLDGLSMLYGNVFDVLSQLIRTAFVPEGEVFSVADFSAIEARVAAWFCGEQWRMDVFNTHGKIYEASASAMFGEPFENFLDYERRGKKHPLRQKGKVAELACQYGSGAGGLIKMGALDMGLQEDELQPLINKWRMANPRIKATWYELEAAAKAAIRTKRPQPVSYGEFRYQQGRLFAVMPSANRALTYHNASIADDGQITYWGVDGLTKKWCEQRTYGGKLLENFAQAIARDYLVEALRKVRHLPVVMHVHDEIVAEGDHLKEMLDAMAQPLWWAPGLAMKADGYLTPYYRKDD